MNFFLTATRTNWNFEFVRTPKIFNTIFTNCWKICQRVLSTFANVCYFFIINAFINVYYHFFVCLTHEMHHNKLTPLNANCMHEHHLNVK